MRLVDFVSFSPRPIHRHPPPAQHHRAAPAAMTHRYPVWIMVAFRPRPPHQSQPRTVPASCLWVGRRQTITLAARARLRLRRPTSASGAAVEQILGAPAGQRHRQQPARIGAQHGRHAGAARLPRRACRRRYRRSNHPVFVHTSAIMCSIFHNAYPLLVLLASTGRARAPGQGVTVRMPCPHQFHVPSTRREPLRCPSLRSLRCVRAYAD